MKENDIIGRKYRLQKHLGEGGSGVVWSAVELDNETEVAIKVFKSQRELQEQNILSNVKHDNVLKYVDFVEHDDRPCIVTELARGGSLQDLIEKHPEGVPVETVRKIIISVSQALSYLHSKRIVHRDVKPDNILIMSEDNTDDICLGDFSIAKELKQQPVSHTKFDPPFYRAPETYRGVVDFKSDLYSLGVVTIELLIGRRPFREDLPDVVAIWHNQTRKQLPSTIPELFQVFLNKVLGLDIEERWSAEEAVEYFEKIKPPSPTQITTTALSELNAKKKKKTKKKKTKKNVISEEQTCLIKDWVEKHGGTNWRKKDWKEFLEVYIDECKRKDKVELVRVRDGLINEFLTDQRAAFLSNWIIYPTCGALIGALAVGTLSAIAAGFFSNLQGHEMGWWTVFMSSILSVVAPAFLSWGILAIIIHRPDGMVRDGTVKNVEGLSITSFALILLSGIFGGTVVGAFNHLFGVSFLYEKQVDAFVFGMITGSVGGSITGFLAVLFGFRIKLSFRITDRFKTNTDRIKYNLKVLAIVLGVLLGIWGGSMIWWIAYH